MDSFQQTLWNMSLINKNIRIKERPYKDYYRIVKDTKEATAVVELHDNSKTVQVDKSRLEMVQGSPGVGANYGNLARTPSAAARASLYSAFNNPMYGSQTPMYNAYGSRTPYYGNQASAYDGAPSHSSAWNSYDLEMPAHSSFGYEEEPEDYFKYMQSIPTPAATIDETQDDSYYQIPKGVNPSAGYPKYELQAQLDEFYESHPPPRIIYDHIPNNLIESGEWCDLDMLVNVRQNCNSVNLHGCSLPIVRVEKTDRKVIIKHEGRREAINFYDILPAPPKANGMAQIIYNEKTGKLYGARAPSPKSVRSIKNDKVTFEDGEVAMVKHCVACVG